jgi:hypothetical protein
MFNDASAFDALFLLGSSKFDANLKIISINDVHRDKIPEKWGDETFIEFRTAILKSIGWLGVNDQGLDYHERLDLPGYNYVIEVANPDAHPCIKGGLTRLIPLSTIDDCSLINNGGFYVIIDGQVCEFSKCHYGLALSEFLSDQFASGYQLISSERVFAATDNASKRYNLVNFSIVLIGMVKQVFELLDQGYRFHHVLFMANPVMREYYESILGKDKIQYFQTLPAYTGIASGGEYLTEEVDLCSMPLDALAESYNNIIAAKPVTKGEIAIYKSLRTAGILF